MSKIYMVRMMQEAQTPCFCLNRDYRRLRKALKRLPGPLSNDISCKEKLHPSGIPDVRNRL